MKYFILVIAFAAVLQNFNTPAAGSTCKANYPKNDQADIFPEGYFKSFSEGHPIKGD